MDGLLREIQTSEKTFLGGELNRHVGKDNIGYESVDGGQRFGEKNELRDTEENELRDTILDFALAFDLIITNTCFKK